MADEEYECILGVVWQGSLEVILLPGQRAKSHKDSDGSK